MIQKRFPEIDDIYSVVVVNVDNENDFVDEKGSLSVPGASQAADRAAGFIGGQLCRRITHVVSSFDKHGDRHIFYATWWQDQKGNHPDPFTNITYSDVAEGKWMPLFEKEWSIAYVKKLGSFTIWPVHCTADTWGSRMYPVISAAITAHSIIRDSHRHIRIEKGQSLRTEHYGIFGSEVEDPSDPRTKLDTDLIRFIANHRRTYWLGQEGDHCVRRSLEQYITWCEANQPDAIPRMRYVQDCISLLNLGPEYQKDAEDSVRNMVQKGMMVVDSTDPIF